MIRNQAGQVAGAQLVNATTGAAFSGTVTVYVTLDGGVQAIGTVGSGLCTLEGNGYYTYAPSADETNGAMCAFTFIGTGAIPATIQYPTITAAQSQALQSATGAGVLTGRDLVTDALLELNVYDPSASISPEDSAYVLRKLNRILDNWNAERDAVYAEVFNTYTLTASLSPHTIGPSGTWVVTSRPVSIERAVLLLSTTNSPHVGINIRDAEWYGGLTIPSLSTSFPTDLYYEPDWPNGSLYFYPVPSSALSVVLWTRTLLARLALSDAFTLPPGYQDALTLTLCEDIAPTYEKTVAPSLAKKAAEARARIFANNVEIPRLVTQDSGMPRASGSGGSGTYYSGWWGRR